MGSFPPPKGESWSVAGVGEASVTGEGSVGKGGSESWRVWEGGTASHYSNREKLLAGNKKPVGFMQRIRRKGRHYFLFFLFCF